MLSNPCTSTTTFCGFTIIFSYEKGCSPEGDYGLSEAISDSYRFVGHPRAGLQIRCQRLKISLCLSVERRRRALATFGWREQAKIEPCSGLTGQALISLQLRRQDNHSLQFCQVALFGIGAAFERGR